MATGEGGGDWRGSVVSDETLAQLRHDGVLGTRTRSRSAFLSKVRFGPILAVAKWCCSSTT